MKLISEIQYFPSIDYYKLLIKSDFCLLEAFEYYRKGSYRNRCYISGPQGRIRLSIPLEKGKNQHTLIPEVRIANETKWQSLHWKSLCSAYRRSPWFEFYEEGFLPLFERRFRYLLDWDLELMARINGFLGWSGTLGLTESFLGPEDFPESAWARDRFHPPPEFGLEPDWWPRYHQVFEERTGFLPNLSILDLLFCEGKRCRDLLSAG